MKSVIRIALAVLVIISPFVAMYYLGQSDNPAQKNVGDMIGRLLMFSVFFIPGSLIIYAPIRALRQGVIGIRSSRYYRIKNPFGFWFYIFFCSFLGLLALGFSISYLFGYIK